MLSTSSGGFYWTSLKSGFFWNLLILEPDVQHPNRIKKEMEISRLFFTYTSDPAPASHANPPNSCVQPPHPKTINEKFTGRLIASKNLIRVEWESERANERDPLAHGTQDSRVNQLLCDDAVAPGFSLFSPLALSTVTLVPVGWASGTAASTKTHVRRGGVKRAASPQLYYTTHGSLGYHL